MSDKNNSINMQVVVGACLVIILLGGAFYIQQNSSNKQISSLDYRLATMQSQFTRLQDKLDTVNKDSQVESTFEMQETETVVEDSIVYNNSVYGFKLTLPATWKGYSVASRKLNWGTNGTGDSIDFAYGGQDSLFNISIHTKKQWQNVQADQGPKPNYIAENSKYVFAYSGAQDAANDEIVARMKEISSIIKTFEFIK
ncbi:MAG: hypothetical protein NTY12_03835 [Candidatus Falkowbacteria bacterium]|nr:hypothetical protein [Candidatus Falkowbacteria bacterium]